MKSAKPKGGRGRDLVFEDSAGSEKIASLGSKGRGLAAVRKKRFFNFHGGEPGKNGTVEVTCLLGGRASRGA